jgi:hypothetical protein
VRATGYPVAKRIVARTLQQYRLRSPKLGSDFHFVALKRLLNSPRAGLRRLAPIPNSPPPDKTGARGTRRTRPPHVAELNRYLPIGRLIVRATYRPFVASHQACQLHARSMGTKDFSIDY